MASKIESESLYGSSIYHEGQFADESDLPEYAQLCRRLFPTLLEPGDDEIIEPETEEGIARYLKYLTGLPLASLKMEPTLLQSDLQRISKELSALLLNETTRLTEPVSQEGMSINSADNLRGGDGEGDASMFEVIYELDKLAVPAVSGVSAELDKTQDALAKLEAACSQFTTSISELDQRAQVIQRVLDKQDLITRFVELPRVMQMCVAGGYYEEAVDISEHVSLSGDRLAQDIRASAHMLPGSKFESQLTAVSRDQLLGFIANIQKQVHIEFESMVLDLCRELGYTGATRSATSTQSQQHESSTGISSRPDSRHASDLSAGTGSKRELSAADGGSSNYEKSIKRLSQVAKIVGILRRIGMFSEAELRMLYLRSRWQAWLNMAESLSGLAPPICAEVIGEQDLANDSIASTALSMARASAHTLSASVQHGADKAQSLAEVAVYLTKYVDAFFSWLTEVEMQYRTLFSTRTTLGKTNKPDASELAGDPLVDLATFASQQFLATTLPLLGLLNEASSIANLQSLVAAHSHTLARGNIDFALPFLAESLRERAFASVVSGIEVSIAEACEAVDVPNSGGGAKWERLAIATRPSLELPAGFTADTSQSPSQFFDQCRVSPVGLLQYPLLADLLHSFRNSLHALRILVLAGDSDDSDETGTSEVMLLLSMASVVFESELVRMARALAELCTKHPLDTKSEEEPTQRAVRDVCIAFVFGLARNVAEIFEEITTLNEPA
ncbi:hypothetical protein LPJ70_000797, partial [Coemansia sp. RSA 2708]